MFSVILLALSLLQSTAPAAENPPAGNISIAAKLQKAIASNARLGQEVRMQVEYDVTGSNGAVLIPAGARLSGKVTAAHARSSAQPAELAFEIERAEWKKGSMPLRATIVDLQSMGEKTQPPSCPPTLGGAPSACAPGVSNPIPVPRDCSVAKVGDESGIVCTGREVKLTAGAEMRLSSGPRITVDR